MDIKPYKIKLDQLKSFVRYNPFSSALLLIGLIAFLATIAAFAAIFPFDSNPDTILWLLTFDLILFSALGIILIRQAMTLWIEHKKGKVGSKLHIRLITVFITAAAIPGILIAIVSTGFFYLVVQSWFSDRVKTAVDESFYISQAYLIEHQQVIKGNVSAMAQDLNNEIALLSPDSQYFQNVLDSQTHLRSLSEALIFDGSGKVIARSGYSNALEFYPVTEDDIHLAHKGDVVLWPNYTQKPDPDAVHEDRMRALVRLEAFGETYLYVSRLIDGDILNHLHNSEKAVSEYHEIETFRTQFQYGITLFFIGFTFFLVAIAVLYGIKFSRNLVTPIQRLIRASDKIRDGDLSTRLDLPNRDDELRKLTIAFNRMTEQLEYQHQDITKSRHDTDLRRQLMEKILSAVTSGVVSLDHHHKIITANHAAETLLSKTHKQLFGKDIIKIIPAIETLFTALKNSKKPVIEDQINLLSGGGAYLTFHVTLSAQELESSETGYVMTFDDISEILSAQKKNAWSDVARRIAHEIKNPLTPIQLSAERLGKKYTKQIQDDPATFKLCLDTIQKHVSTIGRMVNEFSNFAKMPEPKMQREDLSHLCKEAVSLYQNSEKDVAISLDISDKIKNFDILVDADQINQTFSNLLLNAIQAIKAHQKTGHINLALTVVKNYFHIVLSDDGPGFPSDKLSQLTDPYVTTKEKGTGLGLAIVKKIIEDHAGNLVLRNKISHTETGEVITGAQVIITLPKLKK